MANAKGSDDRPFPNLRSHIRGRVSIDYRPALVDERSRIGDWELDTIHGSRPNGLVTAVERKAGLARLDKVSRHGAAEVCSATMGHFEAERDTNENTNGLVRQYFPKGTDFDEIEPWEIQWIEDRLNNRPRKRLG